MTAEPRNANAPDDEDETPAPAPARAARPDLQHPAEAEAHRERQIHWREAHWWLTQVWSVFGPPARLLALSLGVRERERLSRWLDQAERLVRNVILGAALGLILPPMQRGAAPSSPRRAEARLHEAPDTDDSSAWRVSFDFLCAGPDDRDGEEARIDLAPRDAVEHAAPCGPHAQAVLAGYGAEFARRAEALARVMKNPHAFVRRYARRIHDHGASILAGIAAVAGMARRIDPVPDDVLAASDANLRATLARRLAGAHAPEPAPESG